jgi:hypothetical protein
MTAPLAADYELIRVNCHNCGKRHRLYPGSAGKQFRCRKCGMKLTVPGQVKQQPAPPPGRPVRSWAIWLGCVATVTIAVSVLRMDVKPEVTEQPSAPVEVAEAEPEPEPDPEPDEPVVAAPAPPAPSPQPSPPAPMPPAPRPAPPVAQPAPPGAGFQALLQLADSGNADAMYKVAQSYENGEGVEQDSEMAAAWYEEAANGGNRDAMYTTATMYERGEGVDQDYEAAAEWYLKAAEAGDPAAMRNIGLCYAVGKGVQQDKQLAAQWLKKSADAGYQDAQPMLGLVLAGVPAVMAANWMSHAIGAKHAEAHKPPEPVAMAEDDTPHESRAEWTRRIVEGGWKNLFAGRRPTPEQRQRQNFIRWSMRGGLPNGVTGGVGQHRPR